MRSTMQHGPLLISGIVRHGQATHGASEVVTVETDGYRTATFAQVAQRAEQLAAGLERLGIRRGERVATFCWNNQTHLEAYLAVPSMGAVLHTLNVRLFPEQLAYVMNHAEDKVVVVDASLAPLLARVYDELKHVETVIVAGAGDTSSLGDTLSYDSLLAAEEPGFEWPALDELDAASMCYTSGTTGAPKGVVYSHRSTYLHTLGAQSTGIGVLEADRALVVVPMFHANAWGIPYMAWLAGADMVMPQHNLGGEQLARIMEDQRVTVACGVPTLWTGLLVALEASSYDVSSLRRITAGGAPTPRSMFEAFERTIGIPLLQGWGMTETSPVAALAVPPRGVSGEAEMSYRLKAGRIIPGVETRIAGEAGQILPRDGTSIGEIEVRGPWVTASYYKDDDPARFHDGWLRTGDIGTMDELGYLTITDRSKDVIKSGGEWISSVELENEVMAHPGVIEAAAVAVPDARWQERPLVCVVRANGAEPSAQELVDFLQGRVARWWLPERWAFLDSIPKTSVGKFDKRLLRAQHAEGSLPVETVVLPPGD
jgi:fatty-acyl-CoA synthase